MRKYIILILIVLFSCEPIPQSAYNTKNGKIKQKYYNALYLGNKADISKYGKKLKKRKKQKEKRRKHENF